MNTIYYHLAKGIVVREESFGLLFYDSKSTNLTFINSGRLISVRNLEKKTEESDFMHSNLNEENKKIKHILTILVKKGLLYAENESL